MSAIQIIEGNPPQVVLQTEGHTKPLPALWMRARSYDPSQRDQVTNQRLMNPHQLPTDLTLTAAQWNGAHVRLSFSDGFTGDFDPQDFIRGIHLSEECPAARPWSADLSPKPIYQWVDLDNSAVMHKALRDFIERGFLLVHGSPTQQDSILQVAGKFGYVRDTNFGAFFEVYSRPGSNDLAYRPVPLGPHTDNPYRTPVPGIQILQCLQNETSGGFSTLVDSLAVAEQVRHEDPEGFALLSKVPVRFEYRDSDKAYLVQVTPLIELDGQGRMVGVHYSPRLDDIPLMSEADTRRYHGARKRLGELFESAQYELRFRLEPGQFMMFDNNRVLHGRTAFDPSEGHRQLQGCYIDRDAPRSNYRLLSRQFGA